MTKVSMPLEPGMYEPIVSIGVLILGMWCSLLLGIVLGYLAAKKVRNDIREVISDRRIEEELDTLQMEKAIRDADGLEQNNE